MKTDVTAVEVEASKPALPQFKVKSRKCAERIARVLYGPTARVWKRHVNVQVSTAVEADGSQTSDYIRHNVQIGTEYVGTKEVKTTGVDYTDALLGPVSSFLTTAPSRAEAVRRIRLMAADATVDSLIETLIKQWKEEESAKNATVNSTSEQ